MAEVDKPRRTKRYDYIRISLVDRELICYRCGDSLSFSLPMPVNVIVAMGKAYRQNHKSCKQTEEGRVLQKTVEDRADGQKP